MDQLVLSALTEMFRSQTVCLRSLLIALNSFAIWIAFEWLGVFVFFFHSSLFNSSDLQFALKRYLASLSMHFIFAVRRFSMRLNLIYGNSHKLQISIAPHPNHSNLHCFRKTYINAMATENKTLLEKFRTFYDLYMQTFCRYVFANREHKVFVHAMCMVLDIFLCVQQIKHSIVKWEIVCASYKITMTAANIHSALENLQQHR